MCHICSILAYPFKPPLPKSVSKARYGSTTVRAPRVPLVPREALVGGAHGRLDGAKISLEVAVHAHNKIRPQRLGQELCHLPHRGGKRRGELEVVVAGCGVDDVWRVLCRSRRSFWICGCVAVTARAELAAGERIAKQLVSTSVKWTRAASSEERHR